MGWIIVLCVVAVLCIAVAVYRARTSYRRGSPEGAPELAGTWETRHQASVEGQTEHRDPPGAATW
jgi:hypothetical protein